MPLLDATFWMTAAAILVLLLLSAFFSGSETALTAASRGKLRTAADKGSRGAESALIVTEDNERLIGSILLGNNVVNILATSLATAILTKLFGQNGVALATLGMTLLVLIFSEVLPKTYAITNPETVAARVASPIRYVILVFSPMVSAVRLLVRLVLRMFGVKTDPDSNILAVREEIAGALQLGHSEGVVEKEDRDRILGALDLSERFVEEVMLHRSGIQMIDASLPVPQILAQVLESPHRMLEDGTMDTDEMNKFDIMSVAMKPYFIPETTTLDDQMRKFLERKTHFALVVDEYGGLEGLITLEDILEEIVGEIADEFDVPEEDMVKPTADGAYIVDGSMTLRDLNRAHDWNLPDDEANTVAGLVIHEAQMIPVVGQVFSFHGFRFEVIDKEQNRITSLKIRPLN